MEHGAAPWLGGAASVSHQDAGVSHLDCPIVLVSMGSFC